MKNLVPEKKKLGGGISPMLSDQLWLLTILAAVAFVLATVIVFIVSIFTEIRISAWGVVGSIAPWYIAIMSGWIVYIQVPIFVAHGRTRKSGYREWLNTGLAMAPLGAILMTIGFLLERGVYSLAGFSTEAESARFFTGGNDLFTVLYQYLLTFGVWFALGGFVGGALYRSEDLGWLSIPLAIGVASLTGFWNHTGGGFFAVTRRFVPGINTESLALDLGLSAIGVAIGVYFTWKLVQDVALRNP